MDKDLKYVHPDGGYGWVIVAAIILINCTLQTLVQNFGIIFREEFKTWNVTSAQTSFLLHLQSSLYCSFGFFCSPLLKKYSMRLVAFVGAILMCSGILLSSFANSYIYLIVSVSVFIGLGQGILMPATYLAQYTYFKKRLTIAVSLCVTGASLSPIIVPKVCDILLSKVGRTNTILVLFSFSLLGLVGCYLLIPVKNKTSQEEKGKLNAEENEELGDKKDDANNTKTERDAQTEELIPPLPTPSDVYNSTVIVVKKETVWSKVFKIFDLQLLKDVPFVLIITGLGISFASELNIILMLQFILSEFADLDRSQVATAASIQAVADIFGRLVVPLAAHACNVSSKVMYGGSLLVACVGRTVLAFNSHSLPMIFASVALLGVTKGSRAVFQSVIIPKYVPLDKVATATGLNMLFTGAVSLVIGPIIGAVADKTSSQANALHAASLISILCVIMWILESLFFRPKIVDKGDIIIFEEKNI